jgi:putative salt-induced outer membrane protein YdiY
MADRIVLKNGDRLTGKIVKADGKSLVLATESAGEITIQWAGIQEVASDRQLHVELSNGQTVVGPVTTSDGKIEVATQTRGNIETPRESIVAIRNDADQLAYEESLHPGLLAGWNGGANVGFSLTRGNSATENVAIAFNAARPTRNDKLSLYATSLYTANNAPGAIPSTTANTQSGGIRYDRNLNSRSFAFGGADFMSNGLQDLDLRAVGSAGFGLHAINHPSTTLDLFAGGNYTHESYSTTPQVTHSLAGLTLGQELMRKLSRGTVLTEKVFFYPDLSDTGQYRGTFDFGTVTRISKWLGWQNQFGDVYVSNPPPGTKKNDIAFTTGLNVSFRH